MTEKDEGNEPHGYRRAEALARSRLANERTLAAWLRTGLSVAAAGLILMRFIGEGLRFEQGFAWLGGGFIVTGAALIVFAAHHYRRAEREIEKAAYHPPKREFVLIAVAVAVLILFVLGLLVLGALTPH